MGDFEAPFPLQFRGSALARWTLALAGWKVTCHGFPTKQGVLVVYPHTSNWDFVVMILAKWTVGVQVQFWSKSTLFDIPVFGPWLRWLGGVPIDRSAPNGVVGQMTNFLREKQKEDQYFWLGLAPEGSRSLTTGWRGGFYHAAVQANVPVGLIRLDYGKKQVFVTDFIQLSGDAAIDFARIAQVYEGVQGCVPANASPIQLQETRARHPDTTGKTP